ncbi:MAG: hypothetical protein PHV62_04995 [Sulfuricurvum sp.]|nr:hypothetical protein [Sulfuricurvum sp.]
MKTFKLLSRLFAVFGLVMIFTVSGWGANVDLNLSKTAPSTVVPGASLAYTLTARNNTSNKDLSTVKLVDTLPLGVSYSSRTGTNWTCSASAYNAAVAQVVTCTLGVTLNRNTTAQVLTINTTAPSREGSITNYAIVSQTGDTETTPNDNNSTATTDVHYSYTADNFRNFALVNQNNILGDMKIVGNSVMLDTGGVCPNNTTNNNDLNPVWANLGADGNASIYNSTSANLTLPAGVDSTKIKYAGLYWQGRVGSTDSFTAGKTILFKPQGIPSYQSVTSADSKFNWSIRAGTDKSYQGIADVTSLIKQSINTISAATITSTGYSGTLWAANILAKQMSNGFGAWSLVVVYENSADTLKNISVYDGYKEVTGSNTVTVPLAGFLTPKTAPVNSKFLFFGGEGDISLDDSISLTNKAGSDVSLGNNVFNSSETNASGSNITTRNPSCQNTIGIDIHTVNIGTNGTPSIIGTEQNSTIVKLQSGGDTYYPGVFAFSTDLYEPDVCYVENIFKGTTNISGIGAQVNQDDNLTVRVYIKNKGTETASGVSVLHQFDSSFPYAVNSANYNNSNPAYEIVMPPITYTRTTATDSAGNDLYEYNSTSLLAKINLGTGATSGSGGTFTPNTTFAVFEYNASVKILDSNYSNVYQVGYINSVLGVDYTNNPITMKSCDGSLNSFYGYSAPVSATGDFNVVYTTNANGALSSGYYYNLPTAIASRADNYRVIALNTGTDTLKDINTTVAVELVDASSGTCSTYPALSSVKTWIPFNSTSTANFSAADIINGVVLADPQAAVKFYQKAGKNVKFRVSYPTDGSGGVVVMTESSPGSGLFHLDNFPSYAGNTCVYPVTATKYQGNSEVITTYTQVPQACANAGTNAASAMTQHEVDVCLECIYGASVNYTCSKDNFAIRPEAFYVKLSDQNQTTPATKLALANNISGAVSLNLASGYQYYAEVNATNHVDINATSGYTTTEGLDSIWTPAGTVVTGCNDDTNKSSVLNFVNGLVEANLSVDQVGKYSLNITDDQWASVDSNVSTMAHHVSPYFQTGVPDCTLNSAVTSALGTYNGCNISSNHVNNDAGITYVDMGVTYRPYDFNLTSIQMSRGQNFAGTIMSQNTWTYMNSVNVDENMSVRYFGPIRAVGKTGTLLSNYVNDCYAQPVNMDLNLTFPVTAGLPNWRYRLQEVNATNVWRDSNATITTPSTNVSFPLLTIPQTSFLKNQNGLADMNLSLNFDRNQTLSVNPITVGLKNFQIKCQVPGDCSTRADFSTTHLPDANVTTDNNTTFVYGRIIPRDVRTFGSGLFTASAWYEVFNTTTIGTTALPISKNDAVWYTNTLHSDTNDGDGNVTVVITGANPANAAAVNGMETYTFGAGYALGGYKAHILTKPWLWYGISALPYLDPADPANLDCLTHPCFNINVVPSVGATGSAKSTNTATKASKRSTEGGGAWKSTKDYAPAIR